MTAAEGEVLVGPLLYRIRHVTDDELDAKFADTDNAKQVIRLLEGMPKTGYQDALLHECLHAIIFAHGLSHTLGISSYEEEEALVRVLTPALLSLLKFNPDLVKALTED